MKDSKMVGWLLIVAFSVLPLHANAWGGVTTGKISTFEVTGAGNLPFRVYLVGNPVLCESGYSEGYLDDSDPNYKVYVAALMMAKALGSTVTLYANAGAYNRCKIGYMGVQ